MAGRGVAGRGGPPPSFNAPALPLKEMGQQQQHHHHHHHHHQYYSPQPPPPPPRQQQHHHQPSPLPPAPPPQQPSQQHIAAALAEAQQRGANGAPVPAGGNAPPPPGDGQYAQLFCKYSKYDINVDPLQGYRATELKLLSCARPHMRAFHMSWWTFFVAFTAWFAFAPLAPAVIKSMQSDMDAALLCPDEACVPPADGSPAACERAGDGNATVSVTAGGFGPLKNAVPSGSYPKGKDKRHDQTGESCKAIRKRRNAGMWTANIASVGSTIFMRLLVGPLCDMFGARTMQAALLVTCSVPTFFAFAIHNFTDLAIIRACIGFVGASFVMTQYWSSMMFARNCVGVANGTSGGWGNLGGGVTQGLMIGIFTMMQAAGHDDDKAWRLAMIVPALILLLSGVACFLLTDDCPKGNYRELKEAAKKGMKGGRKATSASKSAKIGFADVNSWLLAIQYASSFGMELHVNNALAWYLYEGNEEASGPNVLSLQLAGIVASSFGAMNLFARSLGGLMSDKLDARWGMRGRLLAQAMSLVGEGVMLVIFSRIDNFAGALVTLLLFSCSVQAGEGSTYAIVPYVDPRATGTIAGIVGAGGNIGAAAWGMLFLFGDQSMSDGFMYLGLIVIGTALLTPFIRIPGHRMLVGGADDPDARVKADADAGDDAEDAAAGGADGARGGSASPMRGSEPANPVPMP